MSVQQRENTKGNKITEKTFLAKAGRGSSVPAVVRLLVSFQRRVRLVVSCRSQHADPSSPDSEPQTTAFC